MRERLTEPNQKAISRASLLLFVFFLVNSIAFVLAAEGFSREDFPQTFVFGAATSAHQVEGAPNEDGRTPSIWDASFDATGGTAEVACDQYHKYKLCLEYGLPSSTDTHSCLQEDVQLMADTGIEAYKFSISWSRLIPNGRGPVNPKGLQYYNNLINELITHGIQPHITLHHNDLPLALDEEYGGWVNRKIVKDFTAYADVCFREFGDRVLHWSTVNEANVFAIGGYDAGTMAPFRCSPPFGLLHNCSKGNSTWEPYMVAHNVLLAHASTVKLYRHKYQNKQRGFVGLVIYTFAAATESKEEETVIQRFNDFYIGWILDPLVFGDYPETMKRNAGSRLPAFTNDESELVKGSFDFIGVLYYTYATLKDNPDSLKMQLRDFNADVAADVEIQMDIATLTYPIAAWGLRSVLEYIKRVYGNPTIYIYENGQSTLRKSSLEDTVRINYLQEHIGVVLEALRNGSNTKGYFVWSLLDMVELLSNQMRFGLYHVDSNLKRYPKKSANWYSNFLKGGNITTNVEAMTGISKF